MDAQLTDGLLSRAVEEGVVPGVVAVVGDRDGTIYEGASGRLSLEGNAPVRPDTMFRIASMTKAWASVAALQLLEQGQIELEQPVADILPAFGELQVLEGFDGDEPRLRPPAGAATIRHLLTHTSGVGYWFANADVLRYQQMSGIPDPTTGLLASLEMPLVADPGSRWEYGMSTDWIGLVVGAVSGQDLAAYCAEHIFAPLGMTDSTFSPSEEQSARMMAVHFRMPDGQLVPMPMEFPAEPEFWSGGSGGFATGSDYLRFMRAILRGGELDGERILAEETVDLAFRDHLHGAPLPGLIRSAIPELCNDIPARPEKQGWGLGFHLVLEDVPGMRSAGTGDWAGLFNTYYWIDRARGVAAAILTQALPFYDAGILDTAVAFEQATYAESAVPTAT